MKDILIKIGLIAVIVLLVFFLIGQQRNTQRIERNFEQMYNEGTRELFLTRQEFREYTDKSNDSLFDYIKDSLKLKYKHITTTINHKYTYTYDSTQTLLITHENDKNLYFQKEFDKCLKISGHVNDSTIFWDEVTIDYEAETVYYWQRKHKILGIHYGKKEFTGITQNKCTGDTKVIKIEIKKR
jgi:hypothetical protein